MSAPPDEVERYMLSFYSSAAISKYAALITRAMRMPLCMLPPCYADQPPAADAAAPFARSASARPHVSAMACRVAA